MISKRVNSQTKSLNSIPLPGQASNTKSGNSPPSQRKSRSSSSTSLTARDYAAQKMLSNIDDFLLSQTSLFQAQAANIGNSGNITERPAMSLYRTCLELKKLIQDCPETIERVFLSKQQPNISVFYKVHKATDDMSVLQITCWLYGRTVSEASSNDLTHLIKTGMVNSIFDMFHLLNDPQQYSSADADAIRKLLCTLLMQFDKHDKKIALVARLTGSIPSICDFVKDCHAKGLYEQFQMGLKLLKVFCSCDRNSEIIWKSSLKSVLIDSMNDLLSRQDDKNFLVLSLMFSITKKTSNAENVSIMFSMEGMAKLVRDSSDPQTRKYAAKIIKNCVSSNAGRGKFIQGQAPAILFKLAEQLSQSRKGHQSYSYISVIYEILHECLEQVPIPYINECKNDKRPTFTLPKSSMCDQVDSFVDMSRFFPELSGDCSENALKANQPKSIRDITAESPIGKPLLPNMPTEPDAPKSSGFLKHVLMRDLSRTLEHKTDVYTVVYDVYDVNIATHNTESLVFESRFESGNLRMAVKCSETEYDLLVDSDINTEIGKHNQWFYFSVSNMKVDQPYTFNIINMTKLNGSFNQGMQPVMFSKKSYESGEKGWHRVGSDIFYYQNHYLRTPANAETQFNYATLTFSVIFTKECDTCWFAYHYPYTYSDLQMFLQHHGGNTDIVRRQSLCTTLAGNDCDVLTITNFNSSNLEIRNRQYVLLSARVHPGETNSSWIMQGVLESLLSNSEEAKLLRDRFVFKVVPMLNPDGVIHGSHRCSLSGEDLNRQWQATSVSLYPTIYWTKQLWKHVVFGLNKKPLLVCDFHGHSRRKNVFFFACDKEAPNSVLETLTKISSDGTVLETYQNVTVGSNLTDRKAYVYGLEKVFPKLISDIKNDYNGYNFESGKFATEPSKESTCRIVLWRELGITSSFTCESSYCGADSGPLSIGKLFVTAVNQFSNVMEKLESVSTVEAFTSFIETFSFLKSVIGFHDESGTVVSPTTSESVLTKPSKPKSKGKKKKVLKKAASSSSISKSDFDLTIRGSSISLTEQESAEGSETENQEELLQ